MSTIEHLEQKLDDFNPARRREALHALAKLAQTGKLPLPAPGVAHNLHAHTFFSYNAYGYSPSRFAWLARKAGLAAAGIVDFDVLDGLEEFWAARGLLGLKGCVGLETRVCVPEFAARVINSPGEPGVAYTMGLGFARRKIPAAAEQFLTGLRQTAAQRNRDLLGRVNAALQPVVVDYAHDLLPLTPAGNATERHICLAYTRQAARRFHAPEALEKFWAEKLGAEAQGLDFPEGAKLQNLIRAKMMKKGGVGYVPPGPGSFPALADFNRFVLACGAIPTLCWLDGVSDGEQRIEELLRVATAAGNAALTIIPDRNYQPGVQDQKLKNLYRIVDLAQQLHLPITVGTEMNSPGNKFVDAFESAELQPLTPVFLRGAHIVCAHAALQREGGRGYLSAWAVQHFPRAADRNA
ncbi:MAG: hypothetical protein NTV49_09730, partial [Kiritimatiellaeota bacterium]|nr:hypothetical protein [Kiritimatiellota bacterium]